MYTVTLTALDTHTLHTPHSIMGEGEAVGIVPRFAQELFERVEGTSDEEVHKNYYNLAYTHCHPLLLCRPHSRCKLATMRSTKKRYMTSLPLTSTGSRKR